MHEFSRIGGLGTEPDGRADVADVPAIADIAEIGEARASKAGDVAEAFAVGNSRPVAPCRPWIVRERALVKCGGKPYHRQLLFSPHCASSACV